MVAIIGMVAGAGLAKTDTADIKDSLSVSSSKYSGRQVEEIIRYLETKYVGDVEADALVQKAIAAMMTGLDPHTHYFPPNQQDELEERNMGHYVGIGIEFLFIRDSLIVLYPKENSPAEKAGIKPGDCIVAINGIPIPNDSLSTKGIIDMIKGEKGTSLTLTLKSLYQTTLHTVELKRNEIKVPSVPAAYMLDSTLAYIKLDRFINGSYKECMDAWERMATENGARHLMLDLRDNPGGYLKEAVNLLSQIFEEEGKLLVYTKGKNQHRVDYKSTGKVFFPIENVCVLINENSASASEIVAGCLQDHDRGLIVGTRSFGKGLVQEQFNLSNGGTLRMTVSKYYTPSGRSIQKAYDRSSAVDTTLIYTTDAGRSVYAGGGILPDIVEEENIDWKDPMVRRWMEIISEFSIRYNMEKYQGEMFPSAKIEEIKMALPSEEEVLRRLNSLADIRAIRQTELDSLMQFQQAQRNELVHLIEATMVAYSTGEEGWYRAYNEYDPVILKARKMMGPDYLLAISKTGSTAQRVSE